MSTLFDPRGLGLYDPQKPERDACGVGFFVSPKSSHKTVETTLAGLANLHHRGTEVGSNDEGDGAGIMTQVPEALLHRELGDDTLQRFGAPSHLAVGQFFFSRTNSEKYAGAKKVTEEQVKEFLRESGYEEHQFAWREVPLGPNADKSWPIVEQIVLPQSIIDDNSERGLYLLRLLIEQGWRDNKLNEKSSEDSYICSLSARSIVYKGLTKGRYIAKLYPDLSNPLYESNFAIGHERFSTNTASTAFRSHPQQGGVAHNGEINTLAGNINYVLSRMQANIDKIVDLYFSGRYSKKYKARIKNLILPGSSDTGTFGNIFEALEMGGLSLSTALSVMIPSAHGHNRKNHETIKIAVQDISIPWDGPATMVVCNGNTLAVARDLSGFRPLRCYVTADGTVIGGSEIGMFEGEDVARTILIGPGDQIAIDLETGGILLPHQVEARAARELRTIAQKVRQRYSHRRRQSRYEEISPAPNAIDPQKLFTRQGRAHYTSESLAVLLDPTVQNAQEPAGSMGDDSAPIVLEENRALNLFYHFMRQLFAQVTNPPTDSVNERISMSTEIPLGRKFGMTLPWPLLWKGELEKLERENTEEFVRIPATYDPTGDRDALEKALTGLREKVEIQVRACKTQIILSQERTNNRQLAIPMPLAVSAAYSHLANLQLLQDVAIHAHTEDLVGPHELSMLTTIGSKTVTPYLTEETIAARMREGVYDNHPSFQKLDNMEAKFKLAFDNYRKALIKGLLKTMSKIGISPFVSYQGGYNFNFLGIDRQVVQNFFSIGNSRPASPVGGLTLRDIQSRQTRHAKMAKEVIERAIRRNTFCDAGLSTGTTYAYRNPLSGIDAEATEAHIWTPVLIEAVQKAAKENSGSDYQDVVRLQETKRKKPSVIRDLLDIRFPVNDKKTDINQVEPVEDVLDRLRSPSISLGALAPWVHRDIAKAMNKLRSLSRTGQGPHAGSGEGGENTIYRRLEDSSTSTKQIASGRFGVTALFLNDAEELEIKIAQGAKPGEGGALAGNKVKGLIAEVRCATPGVGLISPPPHHDIYSIEDLAQLIYDLKQVNRHARVCVKIVAQPGCGQIAVGIAKGKPDKILISGHVGGTGNAPQTSKQYAGFPWETGLAEIHQALSANHLRQNIILGTDGGLITGRDIVTAALLGAQEFGIGTGSLVALGCMMVKQCHTNKCPAGITVQDPELEKYYTGKPEHLANYFIFLAEDVRSILAKMGFSRLEDIIGRTDLLKPIKNKFGLDLKPLLRTYGPEKAAVVSNLLPGMRNEVANTLDHDLNPDSIIRRLKQGKPVLLKRKIRTRDRAVGTYLAGRIVREFTLSAIDACRPKLEADIKAALETRFGNLADGRQLTKEEAEKKNITNAILKQAVKEFQSRPALLIDDALNITFEGNAGQSFAAFLVQGMNFRLKGAANDYVGKGMSGGSIVVMPKASALQRGRQEVVGNTVLYGATGGKAFFEGAAMERFAVRNSGAMAVVEGCGDHGCEYATGGTTVVLGKIGSNFCGGMKGGLAFCYDPKNTAHQYANLNDVTHGNLMDDNFIHRFLNSESEKNEFETHLKALVAEHARETGSKKARFILNNWDMAKHHFTMFVPKEIVALTKNDEYEVKVINYMRPGQVAATLRPQKNWLPDLEDRG